MDKVYTDHEGVKINLEIINAEPELILYDFLDAIHYKDSDLFTAGGSEIIPFISIFRCLLKKIVLKAID